jgi:hypothetical protein
MSNAATRIEPTVMRQVFPYWSITIPAGFAETFVPEDGYWHAWDDRRSVSMTSVLVTDHGRPVSARLILEQFPAEPGDGAALPPGFDGWAVVVTAPQPARAPRAITGIIVRDGRVLIVTVTAEDLTWAAGVWQSIRAHPGLADRWH